MLEMAPKYRFVATRCRLRFKAGSIRYSGVKEPDPRGLQSAAFGGPQVCAPIPQDGRTTGPGDEDLGTDG